MKHEIRKKRGEGGWLLAKEGKWVAAVIAWGCKNSTAATVLI
jgi:hypothetical protein